MPWFTVRGVYLHERERNGTGIFEERLLLFRGSTAAHARDLAESECREYLRANRGFRRVGEWIVFAVHDGSDLNGSEIWSGLSRANMSAEAYYKCRYIDFELQPDQTEDE